MKTITILLIGTLFIGCQSSETSRQYMDKLVAAADRGDHEFIYDQIDPKSQGRLDGMLSMAVGFANASGDADIDLSSLEGLKGKELFCSMYRLQKKRGFIQGETYTLKSEEGAKVIYVAEDESEITLVKTGDSWNIEVPQFY